MDDECTVVTEDKSLSAHYENRYLLQWKTGDPFSDRRGKESRIFKSLLTTGKWKRVDTGGRKVMSKADVIEVEGVMSRKTAKRFFQSRT